MDLAKRGWETWKAVYRYNVASVVLASFVYDVHHARQFVRCAETGIGSFDSLDVE